MAVLIANCANVARSHVLGAEFEKGRIGVEWKGGEG